MTMGAGADSNLPESTIAAAQAPQTVSAPKAMVWQWSNSIQQVDGVVGVGVAGQTNIEDLLNSWIDAGISPEQAMELINVIMLTQSPVLSADPQVIENARALARRTQGVWAVSSHAQAEDFLDQHAAVVLYQDGVVAEPELMNTLGGKDAQWEDVVHYWVAWSSKRLDEPLYRPEVGTEKEMEQAQDRLGAATEKAGLASVRVPASSWDSPKSLEKLAQRIELANEAIQRASGMEGPVLGLSSRVHLTVGAPRGLGFAWPGNQGDIHIHSSWEDLSHEWIHALELALRKATIDFDTPGGATLSQELTTRQPLTAMERAWHLLPNKLELSEAAHGHSWLENRKTRAEGLAKGDEDEQWRAGYLMEKHEMIAFQWQSHVQLELREDHPLFDSRSHDGVLAPTAQQSMDAKPIWKTTMSLVNTEWWAPQIQAAPTLTQPKTKPPAGP